MSSFLELYPAQDNLRSGFIGSLNDQQEGVFLELMKNMRASEYFQELENIPHYDWFVLRFCRATMLDKSGARVFQLAPAQERLLITLKWRREKQMTVIQQNLVTETYPEGYKHYLEDIRPRLQWIDSKSGRLVTLEKLGVFAQHLKLDVFSIEQWELFFIYDFERFMQIFLTQSQERSVEIGTKLTIMDIGGLGMGMMKKLKLLKLMNGIMGQHYPEFSGPILVFNAPWTFSKMFQIIQPFMDPDTASKLVVSNSFDLNVLKKVCVEDVEKHLPQEYGGTFGGVLQECLHARRD